ncbi:hypothetical protein F511_24033 [Dorcoceras hygrometricum]|uniref:Uncharacterized protein n=1 Tax=Dorcoceras hygrometricum TaxID=472368 RepID=A0A2Z7D8F4_9LAMI|nr:hypothetical protein F511_24033 [Dorcoceras hygrometricum]
MISREQWSTRVNVIVALRLVFGEMLRLDNDVSGATSFELVATLRFEVATVYFSDCWRNQPLVLASAVAGMWYGRACWLCPVEDSVEPDLLGILVVIVAQYKLLSVLGFDPMSLRGLVCLFVALFSGNPGSKAGLGFNPAGGATGAILETLVEYPARVAKRRRFGETRFDMCNLLALCEPAWFEGLVWTSFGLSRPEGSAMLFWLSVNAVDWAVKMEIRPPEFETSICDVKYHVSLALSVIPRGSWGDVARCFTMFDGLVRNYDFGVTIVVSPRLAVSLNH